MGRILIAEDEEGVRTFLAESLARDGHDVVCVADGRAALDAISREPFDVVITDLKMPHVDGMTVLRTARASHPEIKFVVLSAHGSIASAVEAMKLGAHDYLEKPVASPAAVRELVARALAGRADSIVIASGGAGATESRLTWGAPAMTKIVEAANKVAKSAATVLLLGESGTGKEVFARHIHAASDRGGKTFSALNCAVLSENLLESELFGHEKGAFTGAHAQRVGRLELADGGTFFLDEVAELAPGLQAKLLRVLEERSFERVGGGKTVSTDVRFIAATHRDLRAMVKEGSFREDLYHRLAVFPISIPPLRARSEDIVPIAESLLARMAAGAKRKPLRLADDAKAILKSASWPGNVRELRNVLERGSILAEGDTLTADHILLEENQRISAPSDPSDDNNRASHLSLEDMERAAIERALHAVNGNRREAAERLGIGLRTLYDKLKKYDLT